MARCPFALWKPVGSHGGPMRADLGAIEHVTTNHGDPQAFFANANNKASSHFWIADDGTLEQYIDTDIASWAQAGGNYQYVSVETSGVPDQPLTEAQVATFARLYTWGHNTHGWPFHLAERPGESGLGWHGMGGAAWGGHTACPGELRKAQRARIVALAQGTPTPKEVKPMHDPAWVFRPIVADCGWPGGGALLLADNGDLYAVGGAPNYGDPSGESYWGDRKPATIAVITDPAELTKLGFTGPGYRITATNGNTYEYGPRK